MWSLRVAVQILLRYDCNTRVDVLERWLRLAGQDLIGPLHGQHTHLNRTLHHRCCDNSFVNRPLRLLQIVKSDNDQLPDPILKLGRLEHLGKCWPTRCAHAGDAIEIRMCPQHRLTDREPLLEIIVGSLDVNDLDIRSDPFLEPLNTLIQVKRR